MPSHRLRVIAGLLVCIVAICVCRYGSVRPGDTSPRRAPATAGRASGAADAERTAASRALAADPQLAAETRRIALRRMAYAQGWDGELPPALAAFRDWTARYRAASPAQRPALAADGAALARVRRVEMRALIVANPERALAVTVPAVVRAQLPPEVLVELETRVANRGELALTARVAGDAADAAGQPSLRRRAVLGGATYTAHVYGRREPQTSLPATSLHGIALDRELALHESPVRVLEPGEAIAGTAAENCPVTDAPVPPLGPGRAANLTALNLAEAGGRTWEFCGGEDDMIERFAARLVAAEDASSTTPATAAEATTAWTTGTKQVLVIRVDFSDFPGDPMTKTAAEDVINGPVRSFYEGISYGQTSLVGTASDQVYRMPQTGSAYALADNEGQMHTDARNAAGADYTLANFDRIIVLFPNIGTSRVPGSLITFGGEANINGANIWINGSGAFTMATVSHELGHSYGLMHANLWKVTDGNAISSSGTTLEYGDPFDVMGSSSVTGVSRDARHHFNPWHKNRLGWLPDSAVTTVATSGTYRIYRFDSKDASRTQAQALRIYRDGVRWYWVGLRQNFASGSPQSTDAYVLWGFNNRQQSELLDLVTPGTTATDSSLPIGTTFTDAAAGITIKPVARGGTEPAQYLDVEVTVATTPPDVVTAWGREGAYFYSGNTGAPTSPAPETNVPFGLTGIKAVAAGDLHALALKADGTVVAWGDNTNGQVSVPAGLAEVVAIAAGGNVSGAVKRDGTVVLWGESLGGVTTPPATLTNVRQLAIGGSHSVGIYHAMALRTDGTLVGWGDNTRNQATPPAAATSVTAIAASDRLSVALRADGTVLRWGTTFTGAIAFPTGLDGVTAIASSGGAAHALALKNNGTVVAWGVNSSGQAAVPAGLSDVVAIATGTFHSLAVKSDGTVVTWGSNVNGQLNTPRAMPRGYQPAASSRANFLLAGPSLYLTEMPAAQTVAAGANATLKVAATGVGAVTYQWRKDGAAIAGATASTFTVTGARSANAGVYDVVVRDATRTLTSAGAVLSVTGGTEISRIANLSIRTNAGTGASTLIVGFAIGGGTGGAGATKPLLIRGVGPALTGFGVAGALADPQLDLYDGRSVRLQGNNDWNASDAATFASVGAFPLTVGSRDAALYSAAMAPDSYSAQFSGVGGTSGIVLAEIYDASGSADFTAARSRLVNVSARAFSGTGGNILIAGFNISGPASKNVLIRAIGPTLTVFGVTGALVDPKLELFNSSNARIQQNDNWGGTPALTAAFDSVGAFRLDAASLDAALFTSLQPGSYTVQVSGVNNTTGVALVEIYDAP